MYLSTDSFRGRLLSDRKSTIVLPKEIDTHEQPEPLISAYSAAMIRVCR